MPFQQGIAGPSMGLGMEITSRLQKKRGGLHVSEEKSDLQALTAAVLAKAPFREDEHPILVFFQQYLSHLYDSYVTPSDDLAASKNSSEHRTRVQVSLLASLAPV